jgi:hypothetical protein
MALQLVQIAMNAREKPAGGIECVIVGSRVPECLRCERVLRHGPPSGRLVTAQHQDRAQRALSPAAGTFSVGHPRSKSRAAGTFYPSSGQSATPGGGVMTFVQIIEMTTTKASEIEELMDGWMAATEGRRSARRSLLTKDRDRPDTYVQVVEFPSYEEAMANSALPETTAFAEKLSALCSSGPTFRNLDLVRVDEL